MIEEDKNYCVQILNYLITLCVKFPYENEQTANFIYQVDSSCRTLLEIINND